MNTDYQGEFIVIQHSTHSYSGSDCFVRDLANGTATLNTSVSEPIALSAHNKPSSDEYSTVIDAIASSSARVHSASKKCPPLVRHYKSAASNQPATAHSFSSADATSKAANQKRPLRVAPPIPTAKHEIDLRPIGELEHSYAHIVDGLSPPDDPDTTVVINATPAASPTKTNITHNTNNSAAATNTTTATSTASVTFSTTEQDSRVYSTPIPDGMKNYRRMTASKNQDEKSKGPKVMKEKYIRPMSALGLYPPLDDIYTSSCASSQSSVRRKTGKPRSVSARYTEPV